MSPERSKEQGMIFALCSMPALLLVLWQAGVMLYALEFGWGGRIRTSESRFQRPVSYRLTTPQSKKKNNVKFQSPDFKSLSKG